ncbi:GNAT family N-acetyltransferase [Streptomyces beihaiensis]|uniref:GNAT family N-acetyltransferase n=1 Tax=Streptomyces beihaiensis TaxID=2984495 RepID=A0ABT3TQX6_9ACTN|nr:GNAT family N-acetyltransferase [Streptomyces beihaiensis]MCX3059160.1 GNAT family N-acetyltransferase [Streptomyces beihaiensis]
MEQEQEQGRGQVSGQEHDRQPGRSRERAVRVRAARPDEAAALTDLALRSKAHWGYDAAFMAACADELTLRPSDVARRRTVVAEAADGRLVGLATLEGPPPEGELGLMFVDPDAMGHGVGRLLFDHVRDTARALGFAHVRWAADPNAVPFYEAVGGRHVGAVPSGSVPGRTLPLMEITTAAPRP